MHVCVRYGSEKCGMDIASEWEKMCTVLGSSGTVIKRVVHENFFFLKKRQDLCHSLRREDYSLKVTKY
jgi:hypothetical protein